MGISEDSSATLSDDGGATVDTDNDIEATKEDDSAVDLPPTQAQHQPLISPFQEGERVLAYHNQSFYPAKIMKVDLVMNAWRYTVHYIGWKKSWDEVVGMDRLMKCTEDSEENLQEQEEHKSKQEMESYAKTGSKQKSSTGARGKKRRSGSVQKEKAVTLTEKRVNIHIPPALKRQLTDDWECITHLDKLVKLPRSPNVEEILSKYHDYRLEKDSRLPGSVGEVVNGLRRYFDKALPAMLLYKNERQQYEEAIAADSVAPSAIYGAEHLLRLFVKLPDILHNADIEETSLGELQQHLVDFIKFLHKNQSSFFLGTQRSTESCDSSIKKQEEE
ncbi:hypothetical protein ACH5RR_027134 [Cinchona calisaya]|uniref:MRG domain-containing protein n=1 Tax=Cinchona calisaya TaxID=153742 RepID=A0ABD2Z7T1_9GENT